MGKMSQGGKNADAGEKGEAKRQGIQFRKRVALDKDKHHFLWAEINVKGMESTARQMASLSQEAEGTFK